MVSFGRVCVALLGTLWFSMSTATAQLTIIPQERIQEAANPTLAEGSQMLFENEGIINFGSIEESKECWKGEIEWREGNGMKLSITRITTSCNCLVAEWDRRANSNTTEGVIGVKFLPKGHIGGVEQRLFVYTTLSAEKPSAVVRVRGEVEFAVGDNGNYPHSIGALRLRNKRVILPTEGGSERISVMNGGERPLTISHDEKLSIGGVSAHTEPATLESGEEGILIVEWRPNGQPALLYLDGVQTPPRMRKIEIIVEDNVEK